MNRPILLIGCLWLLTLAAPCSAKEWHNISSLKTTRAEVLRLLGEPKHSQSDGREYFEIDNQTVTIRWARPDCYGRASITDGVSAGMDVLVFQITVTPKIPLKLSEVSSELDQASDLKVSRKQDKAALKELYRSWLSNDLDCLCSDVSGCSCSTWNREQGFGYSSSNIGVFEVYYGPTAEEIKAWEQNHRLCSK
jgi:hypothetical protein